MNRIKFLRDEFNMTQKELANRTNLSEGSISLYEKGERKPSLEVLVKLSEIFDCSIDYLLGKSDIRSFKNIVSNTLLNLGIEITNYIPEFALIKNFNLSDKEMDLLLKELFYLLQSDNYTVTDSYKKLYAKNVNISRIEPALLIIERTAEILKGNNEAFKTIQLKLNYYFDSKNAIEYTKEKSNVFPIPESVVKVPIVGKIAAGIPILAIENIIDYAFAPASQIKEGFEYFYLYVEGDSMNLKFNEGDLILIQQQDYLENKEIGIFLIEEEATVKQFREQKGNIFILDPMSSNPINHTQMYDIKETPVKIIGKVISYQGKI